MKGENLVSVAFGAFFGLIPLPIFIGSAAGTWASFAWAGKIEERASMWQTFIACMLMGIAFTIASEIVIGRWLNMVLTPTGQFALAAIVSLVTRFAMPWLTELVRTGEWTKFVPFIKR